MHTIDRSNSSSLIEPTGVSGFRAGVSYLGYHRRLEQGGYLGYGIANQASDFILGYDVRKVIYTDSGMPFRIGLYAESNNITSNSNYGLNKGSVFQLRPYVTTTSSAERTWYYGLHALITSGQLQSRQSDEWIYDYNTNTYREVSGVLDYNTSSTGLGFTLGNEQRMWDFLVQTQLDITQLSLQNRSKSITFESDEEFADINESGLTVTFSWSVHREPESSLKRRRELKRSLYASIIQPTPAPEKPGVRPVQFDPLTGKPIVPEKERVEFDPMTGKPKVASAEPQFDPFTGQAIEGKETRTQDLHVSLLSDIHKSGLKVKRLSISKVNAREASALVVDITKEGLKVQHTLSGRSEVIPFERLLSIEFEGEKKGLRGALEGGLTGCAICVGAPFVFSLVSSGENAIGGAGATVGLLIGAIVGANSSQHYTLNLQRPKNSVQPVNEKISLLMQFIEFYLIDGIPSQNHGFKP